MHSGGVRVWNPTLGKSKFCTSQSVRTAVEMKREKVEMQICSSSTTAKQHDIFQVAKLLPTIPRTADSSALCRIFDFSLEPSYCFLKKALADKYNLSTEASSFDAETVGNTQEVLVVTNQWMHEQAVFNVIRSRKPRTFSPDPPLADPTGGGGVGRCDFCDWHACTAQEEFGRLEREHAVSASNLFKYGAPYHGLVLFKEHHPLTFTLPQLRDFLAVAQGWYDAAATHHASNGSGSSSHGNTVECNRNSGNSSNIGDGSNSNNSNKQPLHPFFIWNCLPRAGASQYHGHGQVMLTRVAVPAQTMLDNACVRYAAETQGGNYLEDLMRGHAVMGLARHCGTEGQDSAWLCTHVAPIKDMEIIVMGSSLTSPAFAELLFVALRTVIDGFGIDSFNCGILNITPLAGTWTPNGNNGTPPVVDSTAVVHDQLTGSPRSVCMAGFPAHPVAARLVSRGSSSGKAGSDYGTLEVVGGASIGNTEPYTLMAEVDRQLAKLKSSR